MTTVVAAPRGATNCQLDLVLLGYRNIYSLTRIKLLFSFLHSRLGWFWCCNYFSFRGVSYLHTYKHT